LKKLAVAAPGANALQYENEKGTIEEKGKSVNTESEKPEDKRCGSKITVEYKK
jgi:hypothetical protein